MYFHVFHLFWSPIFRSCICSPPLGSSPLLVRLRFLGVIERLIALSFYISKSPSLPPVYSSHFPFHFCCTINEIRIIFFMQLYAKLSVKIFTVRSSGKEFPMKLWDWKSKKRTSLFINYRLFCTLQIKCYPYHYYNALFFAMIHFSVCLPLPFAIAICVFTACYCCFVFRPQGRLIYTWTHKVGATKSVEGANLQVHIIKNDFYFYIANLFTQLSFKKYRYTKTPS